MKSSGPSGAEKDVQVEPHSGQVMMIFSAEEVGVVMAVDYSIPCSLQVVSLDRDRDSQHTLTLGNIHHWQCLAGNTILYRLTTNSFFLREFLDCEKPVILHGGKYTPLVNANEKRPGFCVPGVIDILPAFSKHSCQMGSPRLWNFRSLFCKSLLE